MSAYLREAENMEPKRLHEGDIWQAEFAPDENSKDRYHCVLVRADSIQAALLALGEHLPLSDCRLSRVFKMTAVRGVIV